MAIVSVTVLIVIINGLDQFVSIVGWLKVISRKGQYFLDCTPLRLFTTTCV